MNFTQLKRIKMKKETLEEAAERYDADRDSFEAGAKWQAEKMYSEEEVLHMLGSRTQYCSNTLEENWSSTNEWFKQIKKK